MYRLAMKWFPVIVTVYFLYGAEPLRLNELPVPRGYSRISCTPGSYSAWITRLPLKEDKSIRAFDGSLVENIGYNVFSVVDLPLLYPQDLEQCADFAFRLWADYHLKNNLLNKLYLFDYEGNKKYFKASGKSYSAFLKWTMAHANSHSIKKGCSTAAGSDLRPGDMIVQNETGGIGHVSVIMDICESPEKGRLYLFGFSFMPTQEFHIEYAQTGYGKEGWYSLEGYYRYLSDYLDLGRPVLRRFSDQ
jgi:hypothetical protein